MTTFLSHHQPTVDTVYAVRSESEEFGVSAVIYFDLGHVTQSDFHVDDPAIARQLVNAAVAALVILNPSEPLGAIRAALAPAEPGPVHPFVRPGQVAADRPAPDACMQCGRPEARHGVPVPVAEQCDVDWGSGTISQRCVRNAGHEGQHCDVFGRWAPEPEPYPGFPERYPSGAESLLTEDGSLPDDPPEPACSKCGSPITPLLDDGTCHNTGACDRRVQAWYRIAGVL